MNPNIHLMTYTLLSPFYRDGFREAGLFPQCHTANKRWTGSQLAPCEGSVGAPNLLLKVHLLPKIKDICCELITTTFSPEGKGYFQDSTVRARSFKQSLGKKPLGQLVNIQVFGHTLVILILLCLSQVLGICISNQPFQLILIQSVKTRVSSRAQGWR